MHQMGIDPDTLKIHFKQGIEYDEYAGRVIDQPLYGIDREHLAVRWLKFLNKNNSISYLRNKSTFEHSYG